jgi:drug/metabolite transporter (DMT)-like permease
LRAKDQTIDAATWWRLIVLSILWGGSFFFAGLALRELPPLVVVCARVVLGALMLVPVLLWSGLSLPRCLRGWAPFAMMGLLNNVLPMSLIVYGQTTISSGLASVLNATTPLFTVLVLAMSGDEPLSRRRLAGVVCGAAGVAVLQAPALLGGDAAPGVLLCLGAALSYGLSGLWAKRRMTGVPPLVAANGQLLASSIVMLAFACIVEQPWTLPMPSPATWLALLGLGSLSTAIGYILFFQIIERSGPSNVMLVTLLVPITAILLGRSVLGEGVTPHQIAGAAIIATALAIIDGRLVERISHIRIR